MEKGVTNLNRFLLEEQRKYPEATGGFTILIESIAFASKIISREVNKAGIVNIIGKAQSTNVHGEDQQKLDIYANNRMITALDHLGKLCAMASEENNEPILIPDEYPKGKYLIAFDPLDGSSNIDVNISIGTIFGIYKRQDGKEGNACCTEFFQPGRNMVAAGYIIYGSSTMLVYTSGNGVHGFTLDPSIGEYILSHPFMKFPDSGKIYSINEVNYNRWDEATRKFVDYLKGHEEREYTSRYIGSLVADFHRNLLKGGVFAYPGDTRNPRGKLRLLYECAPLAFIAEQAGGMAVNDEINILDIVPTDLHQKEPFYIGSKYEVETYLKAKRGEL
ncbi:Inositol phosphatase/fructose-16-bisphosphatase [Denitrovibrio acetiphilus DSM 12809]|uniref:Fructose-1,6-bisphosphatase class 1 n=1 Tax=Denitrovibrio acetiphilus (strain DSM 12809 / NBRC 114555 / N2460) TaxID=522772 RepID=D4H8E2_DENA2|nr:class 1 fructose-bisphosphatase [Denitrovibrio acetiphilus]ADD68291.1 Inositol phosphatase/fructose-16-bisphosphatase [Denitrovibrio acetiphilus DSM 12809]